MKRILILLIFLFPITSWGATYHVSTEGSNTDPYDTWEKAAQNPQTVVDLIDILGNPGPHTIYIAAGTYEGSCYMYFDDSGQAHSSTTVIGSGRGLTIIDPDTGHTVYGTNSNSNITFQDLTLMPGGTTNTIVYKSDGCDNWIFKDVDFVDASRHTSTMVRMYGDATSFYRCRFFGSDNNNYPIYTDGDSALTAVSCISQEGSDYNYTGSWILYGSGTNDISNCIIIDAKNVAIVTSTGTTNIRNCFIDGCFSHLSSDVVFKTSGTLNVSNSWIGENPYTVGTGLDSDADNDSNNIKTHTNPAFLSIPGGLIVPCIDDFGNLSVVESWEAVLDSYGVTGTFFTETCHIDTTEEYESLRDLVERGVVEVGLHSHSHSDMTVADGTKLWDVTKGAETITIDRSTGTITLSGGGSVTGFKTKSLSTIKTELEGLGATVTPTEAYATSAIAGTIYSYAYGEVIANGTATNQVDLLATDTSKGLYKSEMVDAAAYLGNTVINGDGNITDPQTGTTYAVNSWGAPYNTVNTVSRTATIDAGFEIARQSEDSFLKELWKDDIDLYRVDIIGGNLLTGADEAETRSLARKIGLMLARRGGILVAMGHGTNDISIAEWGYLFDEWKKLHIQVMSAQKLADHIKNSGLWIDDEDGTYSRTMPEPDYRLTSESCLINAGLIPFSDGDGDQYDYAGKLIWSDITDDVTGAWSDGAEIGPYGFFTSHDYYLPYALSSSGYWTGVALRNGSSTASASVNVTGFDQNGSSFSSQARMIPAAGQMALLMSSGEGWVRINSNQPLTGLGFVAMYAGDKLMFDIPFESQPAKTLYVPHLAQDDTWDTVIYFCNPQNSETTLYLTFFDSDGILIRISHGYVIPANGSGSCRLSDLLAGKSYTSGSTRITASQEVAAFALYHDLKSGGYRYAGISAMIPPTTAVQSLYNYYLPYALSTNGYWTGVALRNGSVMGSASVTVTGIGQDGTSFSSKTRTIPADGQTAFLMSLGEGWVKISSNEPLTGLGFVAMYAGDRIMFDIPFVSRPATTLYVPHVAQDDTWDTVVYLCNPHDSETTLNLAFFDSNGKSIRVSPAYTLSANGSGSYRLSELLEGGSCASGSIRITASHGVAAFALYHDLKSGGHRYAAITAMEQ